MMNIVGNGLNPISMALENIKLYLRYTYRYSDTKITEEIAKFATYMLTDEVYLTYLLRKAREITVSSALKDLDEISVKVLAHYLHTQHSMESGMAQEAAEKWNRGLMAMGTSTYIISERSDEEDENDG